MANLRKFIYFQKDHLEISKLSSSNDSITCLWIQGSFFTVDFESKYNDLLNTIDIL